MKTIINTYYINTIILVKIANYTSNYILLYSESVNNLKVKDIQKIVYFITKTKDIY